jgi:hypothetical protein
MTATKAAPQVQLDQLLVESKASSFIDPSFAAFMDERDPLKDLRSEFVIPTRGDIAPGKQVVAKTKLCIETKAAGYLHSL